MKNGIVIPCYNEEFRLKLDEFQEFINQYPEYMLCFVNDGSSDKTLEKLEHFRRGQEDQVTIFDMPQNGGKAAAVRAGVTWLLQTSDVQSIGFVDADLATGFDDYRMLVQNLEASNNEVIIGSRKINADLDINRSFFRKAASYIIGKFINKIIGLDIKDTQCGAKVFSRRLAKEVFSQAFQSRWLFDVEILIRCKNYFGKDKAMGFIKEVALSKWEEVDGSKITLKDSIQFPLQLVQIGIDYNIKPQLGVLSLGLSKAA